MVLIKTGPLHEKRLAGTLGGSGASGADQNLKLAKPTLASRNSQLHFTFSRGFRTKVRNAQMNVPVHGVHITDRELKVFSPLVIMNAADQT